MRFLKTLPGIIVIAAFLLIATLAIWTVRGGCDATKGYFDGVKTETPPPPEDVGIPVTAEPVPVIEDRKTFTEGLAFWVGDTQAEELTKDLPAGTEVYVITDPSGSQTVLYRTIEGYIYKEGDADVEAFRTPEPLIAAEFRPKVMVTTDFSTVGIAAELDMVRLWDVHVGPGAGYNLDKTGWVGAGGGYNVAKNIDVGGYAGKAIGEKGWSGGLSVGIAIE